MKELTLSGGRAVLPGSVVAGGVVVRNGLIAEIVAGPSGSGADLDGDLLIPGVVDVHTDNLERQVQPRPGARWPSRSAMVAHDTQCAVAGVTTVLDALCVGDLGPEQERARTFREGVADLGALAGTPALRVDHHLHLRCELPAADMLAILDPVAENPLVRMVSLMDHSPGVGQHLALDRYREMRRREGMSEAELERHLSAMAALRARWREPNRAALLARFAGRGLAVASHDDATPAEVAENAASGIRISEFPVTRAAAAAAREHGMAVIAGAPNVVRGGSHSGNVAVVELLADGAVDVLASDYVPASLVEAAFRVVSAGLATLPDAVAMITARPARMAGFVDRGEISVGQRADLVRVRLHGPDGLPVVRAVWRGGERVA